MTSRGVRSTFLYRKDKKRKDLFDKAEQTGAFVKERAGSFGIRLRLTEYMLLLYDVCHKGGDSLC